jgi:hypothetical protein
MEDINKFVEQQENVPFTVRNVYKMFEMIVGTSGSRMERVIVEAFDKITKHYHDNRYHVEGWKTNDQWMVNKKFILPYVIQHSYSGGMGASYSRSGSQTMDDIHKALCYVTGTSFNSSPDWWDFMNRTYEKDEDGNLIKGEYGREIKVIRHFGTWYDWGFFQIKGFKKGTLHVKFKDDKVWEKFNLMACKAKGWQLPETTEHDFRKKTTGVEIYE